MKIIRILEIAWLVIGVIAFSIGTYMLISGFKPDAVYFYVFTIVAVIFYFIRRKQRIRMQNEKG